MLTAKTDTIDVVVGLESGADDYVVKPFKPKELVARIRARLRRTEEPAPELLEIGDLVIDVAGHSVKRDGGPIALTPLEFDLLVALARKPWQVFTREVLLEQVWGYRHAADTRLVNVHVQRLRSKIERDPEQPGGRRHRPRRRLQGGSGLTAPPTTLGSDGPPGVATWLRRVVRRRWRRDDRAVAAVAAAAGGHDHHGLLGRRDRGPRQRADDPGARRPARRRSVQAALERGRQRRPDLPGGAATRPTAARPTSTTRWCRTSSGSSPAAVARRAPGRSCCSAART